MFDEELSVRIISKENIYVLFRTYLKFWAKEHKHYKPFYEYNNSAA